MIQTMEVIKLLQDSYPDIEFQVIGMSTIGPLSSLKLQNLK